MTERTPLAEFVRAFSKDPDSKANALKAAQQLLEKKGIVAEHENGILYQIIEGTPHAVLTFLGEHNTVHTIGWDGTKPTYLKGEGNIHALLGIKPPTISADRQIALPHLNDEEPPAVSHDKTTSKAIRAVENFKPVSLGQIYNNVSREKEYERIHIPWMSWLRELFSDK